MARLAWATPELMTLGSGAEAQPSPPASGKGQPHPEGVGHSCEPGIGCPGEDQIIGPS